MRFRTAFLVTLLFNLLIVVVDKGAGLIILSILIDMSDKKGGLDLLSSLPFILMAVANQGLATSLVYHTRRGEVSVRIAGETTAAAAWLSGILIGVLTIATLFVWEFFNPEAPIPSLKYVIPLVLAVPFLLTISYRNSVQLVLGRIRSYNLVHLLPSVMFLPAFLLCYYVFTDSDPYLSGVVARLIPAMVVAGIVMFMVRDKVPLRPRLNWKYYKKAFDFGWRANLNSMLTYLNHRIDLYLVGVLFVVSSGLSQDEAHTRILQEIAYYSLAVTLAELIWYIPDAMRDLLFAKVASLSKKEAGELTPVVSRNAFFVCLVGGLLVYLLHGPAFTLLYGSSWTTHWAEPVTRALAALLPGTAFFTIAKVLQTDLAARGKINSCVGLSSIVFVSMLILDFYLVPSYGATGAAGASSIAYGLSALATIALYMGHTGVPLLQLTVPRLEDLLHYKEILSNLRPGRPTHEPETP